MGKRGFASDNNSGVHPRILKAISRVNEDHVIAYGDDKYTIQAIARIKDIFGGDAEVFFVFNGTAANVLGLKAATESWNSVICAETAHINSDECGAPEKFTGCKLLTLPAPDGKLNVDLISRHMHSFGFEHHTQPGVVSITQATEMGTLYTPREIREIAEYAHSHGLWLHIDGARICNAAAALGVSFEEMITATGTDILSFGGTKNGLMYGEAIVFLNRSLAENFRYVRKQGMQLASKMRYIAAQFDEMLKDDLWLENSLHANKMASLLAREAGSLPNVKITRKVEINGVFACLPPAIIEPLMKEFFFYVWNEPESEVRWMTSWDTTEEDIYSFTEVLKKLLADAGYA